MNGSRRDFLKVTTLGGVGLSLLGFDLAPAYAQLRELKIARATETDRSVPARFCFGPSSAMIGSKCLGRSTLVEIVSTFSRWIVVSESKALRLQSVTAVPA